MLAVATKKRMGRPPKPGKPEYTTVKVEVAVHAKLKTLAGLTRRDIAEIVSELLDRAVDKPLNAALAKQFGGKTPE